MDAQLVNPFNNGYWIWDEQRNALQFISRDAGMKTISSVKQQACNVNQSTATKTGLYDIKFRDITDKLEKLIFRRYFQRRVKPGEPDVITIQDLRDVALYLANPLDLTVEFIHYFHIRTVDRFLRALILYFQYFLDIWDVMLEKRREEDRKLRQPIVTELENVIRDNLADLRAMLAREYLSLLSGIGDAKKYHHMAGTLNASLSEKDRRLFEILVTMAVRVVWIALQRKHLSLIGNMANTGALSPFTNGHWIWDKTRNCLMFLSNDPVMRTTSLITQLTTTATPPEKANFEIKFRDISDKLEKIVFKRHFQRRVRVSERDVITVQDVKDIALYLANTADLTEEFIHFIHTATVDRFLRALIIYFQHYLHVWDKILARRVESTRKLHQPIVTELENKMRDDLSDLRTMLAREYLAVIAGIGDCKKYHHMSGEGTSLSEKDRKLFEMLICLSVRIVWIALQRKQYSLIELEMNRMFRSDSFNIITHRRTVTSAKRSAAEDRVLIGAANRFERTLLQRSPLVKEILFADHDHRMLGAGVKVFQPKDERIDYIEAAYSAPEELLNQLGISVGLLGIPREEFDPVLISRERTSKTYTKQITEIPEFRLPPKKYHSYTELPDTFPKEPCQYKETAQTVRSRKTQCKMWVKHVRSMQMGITEDSSDKGRQSISKISEDDTKT